MDSLAGRRLQYYLLRDTIVLNKIKSFMRGSKRDMRTRFSCKSWASYLNDWEICLQSFLATGVIEDMPLSWRPTEVLPFRNVFVDGDAGAGKTWFNRIVLDSCGQASSVSSSTNAGTMSHVAYARQVTVPGKQNEIMDSKTLYKMFHVDFHLMVAVANNKVKLERSYASLNVDESSHTVAQITELFRTHFKLVLEILWPVITNAMENIGKDLNMQTFIRAQQEFETLEQQEVFNLAMYDKDILLTPVLTSNVILFEEDGRTEAPWAELRNVLTLLFRFIARPPIMYLDVPVFFTTGSINQSNSIGFNISCLGAMVNKVRMRDRVNNFYTSSTFFRRDATINSTISGRAIRAMCCTLEGNISPNKFTFVPLMFQEIMTSDMSNPSYNSEAIRVFYRHDNVHNYLATPKTNPICITDTIYVSSNVITVGQFPSCDIFPHQSTLTNEVATHNRMTAWTDKGVIYRDRVPQHGRASLLLLPDGNNNYVESNNYNLFKKSVELVICDNYIETKSVIAYGKLTAKNTLPNAKFENSPFMNNPIPTEQERCNVTVIAGPAVNLLSKEEHEVLRIGTMDIEKSLNERNSKDYIGAYYHNKKSESQTAPFIYDPEKDFIVEWATPDYGLLPDRAGAFAKSVTTSTNARILYRAFRRNRMLSYGNIMINANASLTKVNLKGVIGSCKTIFGTMCFLSAPIAFRVMVYVHMLEKFVKWVCGHYSVARNSICKLRETIDSLLSYLDSTECEASQQENAFLRGFVDMFNCERNALYAFCMQSNQYDGADLWDTLALRLVPFFRAIDNLFPQFYEHEILSINLSDTVLYKRHRVMIPQLKLSDLESQALNDTNLIGNGYDHYNIGFSSDIKPTYNGGRAAFVNSELQQMKRCLTFPLDAGGIANMAIRSWFIDVYRDNIAILKVSKCLVVATAPRANTAVNWSQIWRNGTVGILSRNGLPSPRHIACLNAYFDHRGGQIMNLRRPAGGVGKTNALMVISKNAKRQAIGNELYGMTVDADSHCGLDPEENIKTAFEKTCVVSVMNTILHATSVTVDSTQGLTINGKAMCDISEITPQRRLVMFTRNNNSADLQVTNVNHAHDKWVDVPSSRSINGAQKFTEDVVWR